MMDTPGKNEFTVQGADPPVPVESEGVRAGPARPSSDDCHASQVIDQAGALVLDTGKGNQVEVSDPFKKRSALARTPPTTKKRDREAPEKEGRSSWEETKGEQAAPRNNGGVEESLGVTARPLKKYKGQESQSAEGKERIRMPKGEDSSKKLSILTAKIGELYRLATENRNTRVDIKELAEEIKNRVAAYAATLGKSNKSENQKGTQTELTETDIREMENRKVSGQKGREKHAVISTFDTVDSLEDWKRIEGHPWADELLARVESAGGQDIFKTKDSIVKIIWTDKTNSATHERLTIMYPEFKNTSAEHEVLTRTSTLSSGEDTDKQTVVRVIHDGTLEDVWDKLTRILQDYGNEERIAMSGIEDFPHEKLKKLVAFVLRDSPSRVRIYDTLDKTRKAAPPAKDKKRKSRQSYALVVEETGREYNQLLDTVKNSLKNTTATKAIKTLRSSRDGKRLVISIDKDVEAVEDIKRAIDEGAGDVKTHKLLDPQTLVPLHIRGMDALATKEELVAGVEEKIGKLTGKIYRMSAFRPNAGNTQAATFFVGEEDADRLIKARGIRVGMTTCRVEKRLKVARCQRCWLYGHQAEICGGTDRTRPVSTAEQRDTLKETAATTRVAPSVERAIIRQIQENAPTSEELSL